MQFLAYLTDYVIEYPLHGRLGRQIYLGPNLTRSCVNFTAIDDNIPEPEESVSEEVAYIFLIEGDKSNVEVENDQLEIYILDDDGKYYSFITILFQDSQENL